MRSGQLANICLRIVQLPTPRLPALLTLDETATALRVSRATVRRMIARGDLEAVRFGPPRRGATVRVRVDELARLLENERTAP